MMGYQLLQGDCLNVLPTLEVNSADTVITDPPYGLSFMGKDWDHGVPGEHFWREVLRVAKPGAMLLAFGGTRTYHRLTCAIEDAGWDVRDCLMWLYGSGFPKSLNLSIEGWQGWGTALKPAWEPIVIAMKPIDGTFANNALAWGVAGLAIDKARIDWPDGVPPEIGTPGWGGPNKKLTAVPGQSGDTVERSEPNAAGRWPANVVLDEEAAVVLDAQSGEVGGSPPTTKPSQTTNNTYGEYNQRSTVYHGRVSGASRFFYVAKAATSERGSDNDHPTVKPVTLMRYLCRLTATPTGGTVLDPFMGSGTTGVACTLEGRDFIGIDISQEYVATARQRIGQTQPALLNFQEDLSGRSGRRVPSVNEHG